VCCLRKRSSHVASISGLVLDNVIQSAESHHFGPPTPLHYIVSPGLNGTSALNLAKYTC
jgi:hypothetical protein